MSWECHPDCDHSSVGECLYGGLSLTEFELPKNVVQQCEFLAKGGVTLEDAQAVLASVHQHYLDYDHPEQRLLFGYWRSGVISRVCDRERTLARAGR